MSDEKRNKKLEEYEETLKELNEVKNKVERLENNYFVWEIDFPEVFLGEKEGFDIVIGNPPYVRQENIEPPLPNSPTNYKDKLVKRIKEEFNVRLSKRSDLYVYFYIHGLNLLNSKGTFCFITSNSWLDVKFGHKLQEFLLDNVEMKAIYDNSEKRSFKQADVNTIITVFGSINNNIKKNWNNTVKFVVFKKPFGKIIDKNIMTDIEDAEKKKIKDDFRIYPITQAELKDQGMKYNNTEEIQKMNIENRINSMGKYKGDKWGGKYLRAPDIFFTILDKAKDKLVKLGDIAEVKRGFTTGCNEFFYLPSKHFDIEENDSYLELIPKSNDLPSNMKIEKNYIEPVIFSLKNLDKIKENLEVDKYVLSCDIEKKQLKDKKVFDYINWGKKGFNKRSTCQSRSIWYSLTKNKKPGDYIFPAKVGERMLVYDNRKTKLFVDKKFYNIYINLM
ncbi:MAG: Eco57I restriction-modification methylase domain-containing protein [archaeon]